MKPNSQRPEAVRPKEKRIPFPEEFEHVKSYTMSGVRYINTNYLPVSESRKN